MKTLGTHFGQGSPWTTFQPMASGNHQRPQDQLRNPSPQLKGDFPIPPCILYSRLHEWCIYGIIYHYAPFLLSNSMVTFSGPNSTIPNQGPKIQRPFLRRTLQLISMEVHGGYQKTIQGPQPPGSAGVGWKLFQDYSKGHSQRLLIIQSVFKAESTSILLGQLNWSIQEAINSTSMSLDQLGQFIFHCGNSITQFNSQDDQSFIYPIQTIQLDYSPYRISLSVFHIYWPPFIT
ncbi:hypothetical protein O181_065554 [Austropuccinia psidii MF-1]|uniref:Uncharacterized protein n=1 Tax=Austropuccinia psidii MF-1 TaxID=1389203 RepID=A0A9Q3ER96_9BASI|nr:hypothetical protein [Austropuccinia psidii MF-1]